MDMTVYYTSSLEVEKPLEGSRMVRYASVGYGCGGLDG